MTVLIELGSLSIKDVMSKDITYVSKDERISDVIARMSEEDVHELPVVENGNVVGVVTYSTLLKKKYFPLTAKAEIVMQHFPQLSEFDPLTKGIEIMINSHMSDLPVSRNNKLVGIVHKRDVLDVLSKVRGLRTRAISEIMTPAPEAVRESDDIRKALSIMRGLDEKNLPVLDKNDRLVGVIGMMDIMKFTWKPMKGNKRELDGENKPIEVSVGSLMNKPAIAMPPTATVEDAIRTMVRKDISTLFVAEDSKLVGVLTLRDVLEQAMSMEKREEGVYVQLTGLQAEDPDIYDSLYAVIQKGLIRISKIAAPRILNVHVATYNHEGLRSKYTIHARLTTIRGLYFTKTTDWDLFRAMNNALEILEKSIKKEREIDLTMRKKRAK
ncbi:MAG: CBS domain-containing protein [Thermoplasmata archaeon]